MSQNTDEAIAVEQADLDDVDVIAPLFDAYRQFYHQTPDIAGARAFIAERLTSGESVIYLAMDPRQQSRSALGFVQLYPTFTSISMRRAWILYDLFVAPQARRRGVGRALLQAARDLGLASGASEISLQTAVDNHAAQALYAALGWQRDDIYLTYVLPL